LAVPYRDVLVEYPRGDLILVATKENMDSPDMKDVLHPDLSQWLKP
jgi:hypothetical protein